MMLEAINLSKIFREGPNEVAAVRGVSLQLRRGEVVGLEGPSGCGKSTLLSTLGCILTPSGGRLRIGDHDVGRRSGGELAALRRQWIGFVFQQFNLFPALTALENVEYALNIRGVRGRAARAEAEVALRAVALQDRATFLPRDLSGGQKQRVAIARALAGGAPLLLADEPTANLDSRVGGEVLSLFRDLATRAGRAVLIVTHDPRVRAICDRVLHMEDGRLLGSA